MFASANSTLAIMSKSHLREKIATNIDFSQARTILHRGSMKRVKFIVIQRKSSEQRQGHKGLLVQ